MTRRTPPLAGRRPIVARSGGLQPSEPHDRIAVRGDCRQRDPPDRVRPWPRAHRIGAARVLALRGPSSSRSHRRPGQSRRFGCHRKTRSGAHAHRHGWIRSPARSGCRSRLRRPPRRAPRTGWRGGSPCRKRRYPGFDTANQARIGRAPADPANRRSAHRGEPRARAGPSRRAPPCRSAATSIPSRWDAGRRTARTRLHCDRHGTAAARRRARPGRSPQWLWNRNGAAIRSRIDRRLFAIARKFQPWLKLVGGDGFEPPTLSV